MDIAPPPPLFRRIVAVPLYAVFALACAYERAVPEWWPSWLREGGEEGRIGRALWWCWRTAERIAPSEASRTFDAILNRGCV